MTQLLRCMMRFCRSDLAVMRKQQLDIQRACLVLADMLRIADAAADSCNSSSLSSCLLELPLVLPTGATDLGRGLSDAGPPGAHKQSTSSSDHADPGAEARCHVKPGQELSGTGGSSSSDQQCSQIVGSPAAAATACSCANQRGSCFESHTACEHASTSSKSMHGREDQLLEPHPHSAAALMPWQPHDRQVWKENARAALSGIRLHWRSCGRPGS